MNLTNRILAAAACVTCLAAQSGPATENIRVGAFLPTIARNDEVFADQVYWREDIWAPTNYLVYEGLTRYGFELEAFDLAGQSFRLFMDDGERNNHADENDHAWGGNGGGDTHYTWRALLCLIALEQYVDVNPWAGLRFGALDAARDGEYHGETWGNHTSRITIGPRRTALARDGKLGFEANRTVVVRRYEPRAFSIESGAPVPVTTGELAGDAAAITTASRSRCTKCISRTCVRATSPKSPARRLSIQRAVPTGSCTMTGRESQRWTLDGKEAGRLAVKQGRAAFRIPAGEHKIELVQYA